MKKLSLLSLTLLCAGVFLNPAMAAPPLATGGQSCLAEATPSQQVRWLTPNGCFNMSFCPDDDYCWSLCPTANSASCVNNVCQFSLPGGGGPGPSGNQCPYQSICAGDHHCSFPGGITGTCVNNTCVC